MTRATDLAAVYEFDMPDRMRKTLRHSSETAASMARYLDVEPESVSRWINGRSTPSGAVVKLWALKMGVSYDWLKNGETPPPDGDGVSGSALPQLDSNQQPFDYTDGEVSGVAEVVELHPIELDPAA